jgi:hypothetical protein
MPLPSFKNVPRDLVEWGKFFRSIVVTPDPGTVDDESFGNRLPASVMGRAEASPGIPADIVSSNDGQVLRRAGGVLSFSALVDSDIPSSIARDSEVTSAIGTHEAAPDPHAQYTTAAELSAAISAHEGASDPHPGYLTQTEGDARYALAQADTYTATLTGCTTSPTGTIRLVRAGNVVLAYIPVITGTSNTTACSLTGTIPAGFVPTRTQDVLGRATDNGVNGICGYRINTSGTIDMFFGAALAGWTAAGTKGANNSTIAWSTD